MINEDQSLYSEYKRKKIIFFDQYANVGGGQRVLLSLIEIALKLDYNVFVAIPIGGDLEKIIIKEFFNKVNILKINEIKLTNINKNFFDYLKLVRESKSVFNFWSHIKDSNLVYINGPRLVPVFIFISMLIRKKQMVYHIHMDHKIIEKYLYCIAAFIGKKSTVVMNSDFTSKRFFDVCKIFVNYSKFITVENGLSKNFSDKKFVDRFSSKSDVVNILIVGGVRIEKGVDVALSVARISSRIVVHIVGPAPSDSFDYLNKLKKQSSDNIIFHGVIEDISSIYDKLNAHIILMPSRVPESFGLSLIEGMSNSCIGICRSIGALTDIAAITGAISFKEDNELDKIIGNLLLLSKSELKKICKLQHANTILSYNYDIFEKNISKVIF